jgi:hypothetical protein
MTGFNLYLINNTEELEVEGGTGGFVDTPPEEGVALFRLISVLEFGVVDGEFNGKAKKKQPVSLEFELVHPRHAITKDDGTFIRNHTVTIRVNKSNSDMGKYMPLFNKLNYDGAVATPAGKTPSFAPFLGQAFFGSIEHNVSEKNGKTYVNVTKDGEFTIGAPRVPEIDATLGTPTGEFNEIPVPQANSDIRCFLWETGVSDDTYKAMWESISITGEKKDGTPKNNWIQNAIAGADNTAFEGSRAQGLFDTAHIELEAAIPEQVDPLAQAQAGTPSDTTVESVDPLATVEASEPTAAAVDPLAALGL